MAKCFRDGSNLYGGNALRAVRVGQNSAVMQAVGESAEESQTQTGDTSWRIRVCLMNGTEQARWLNVGFTYL